MDDPLAFTVPLRTAPVAETDSAGKMDAIGAAALVVKVPSAPVTESTSFVAVALKWYVWLGINPVSSAKAAVLPTLMGLFSASTVVP